MKYKVTIGNTEIEFTEKERPKVEKMMKQYYDKHSKSRRMQLIIKSLFSKT